MSNTKISKISKQALQDFKIDNPDVTFYNDGCMTVLECQEFPNSKMKLVSVSFMSDSEVKFRRKVGEYRAMERFENGEFITIPVDMNFDY